MVPVEIDEVILKKIANLTGGEYFRATNNRALEEIYTKIDKMEKTKIEITSFRNAQELFAPWLLIGLVLLLLELIASKTILRKLP
jgi:Ca-activated chloride channel family protein